MKRIVKLPKAPTSKPGPDIPGAREGEETPLPGFIAIGDGYYDVSDDAEVDPKDVITSGENRYRDLPQNHKNKILDALINEPDPAKSGEKKPKRIKMNQLKAGDEILEANIIPHHWLGESPTKYEGVGPDNTLPEPEP